MPTYGEPLNPVGQAFPSLNQVVPRYRSGAINAALIVPVAGGKQ